MAKSRSKRDKKKRRRGRGGRSTLPKAGARPEADAPAAAAWSGTGADGDWQQQQRLIEESQVDVDVGLRLHQSGKLDEAAAVYREILETQPDDHHALHLLGAIALARQQYEQAETLIRKAMKFSEPSEAMHTNLALVLRATDRLQEALEECKRALEIDPRHIDARFNMGLCLAGLTDHRAAEDAFRQCTVESPSMVGAWFQLGQSMVAQSRWEDAIKPLAKAADLDPSDAENHLRHGLALLEAEKFSEAGRALERCLTARPDDPGALFLLGTTKTRQGFYDEAIENFQAAVRIRPDFVHALSNLGSALRKRDRIEEAVEVYLQAVEVDPDHTNSRFNLGNLYLELGKVREAEDRYAEVVEQDPQYYGAWVNLGNSLLAQDRPDEGVEAYRRATQLQCDDPELSWRNLGNGLAATGDAEAAARAWDNSWDLKQDDSLRLRKALVLPGLLQSSEDREAVGAGLDQRLGELESGPLNLHPLAAALDISMHRLANHDLDTAETVERLVELFQGADPDLDTRAPHVFTTKPPGAVRIGIASASLHTPEVGRLVLGVLQGLPSDRFDTQVFFQTQPSSGIAKQIAESAGSWRLLENHFVAARTSVMEGTLDVLLLPDPWVHPTTLMLQFGRLARVVATLSAPGPTGLEDLVAILADSALAQGAEERYAEKIVALPAAPFYMPRPVPPKAIPEDPARYVCLVHPEKITPEFDGLVAAILAADPTGTLAVRRPSSGHLREGLMARMAAVGVPTDRVRLVKADDEAGLAELVVGARATLDPPGASDPILAARSLGLGVPVITLPGELPRARGALCCYERIGLAGYVVDSDAAYVEAAVALGTASAEASEATRVETAEAANTMFDNDEAILALAEALADVVRDSA